MQIGKILNNEFIDYVDIRKEFPNTSFPIEITAEHLPEGYVIIKHESLVSIDGKTAHYDQKPVLEDGVWVLKLIYTDIPVYVPQSISPKQIRRALLDLGKLNEVEDLINNLEDLELRSKLEIDWKFSTEFLRNNEFIVTLAPLIGLEEEDVDKLFIDASKIL